MAKTAAVLNHQLVQEGEARLWMLVLHGIYGQGRNWSSVARRIVRARPEWGAVLVDLRMHGASQGFAPPHTVAAAAADLDALEAVVSGQVGAVVGHSFGGKVALARAADGPAGLRQVWLIDSTPAARAPEGSAWEMLQVIRSLPAAFATRADLTGALERAGVAAPVAQWMATNLESSSDGFRWRFDLEAIEALLRDFFRLDLWHVVERPPEGVEVHVVKAEASAVLAGDDLARAERATAGGRTFLHRIAGGHWLNADNPDAVVDLLAEHLPTEP